MPQADGSRAGRLISQRRRKRRNPRPTNRAGCSSAKRLVFGAPLAVSRGSTEPPWLHALPVPRPMMRATYRLQPRQSRPWHRPRHPWSFANGEHFPAKTIARAVPSQSAVSLASSVRVKRYQVVKACFRMVHAVAVRVGPSARLNLRDRRVHAARDAPELPVKGSQSDAPQGA